MPAIDCHAHVFAASAPMLPDARYRPSHDATLADWRGLWPEAGVTHGVLVQPSFFGTDNSALLAAMAADPDRLRGVAVVDPDVTDAELGRLAAAGVRAVRLNLQGIADLSMYAGAPWQALFERLHALGMHIEMLADPGRLPALLPAFLHAKIAIVLDHFGNPGADDAQVDATFAAIDRLKTRGAVHAKLSGWYRLRWGAPGALSRRLLEVLGSGQLVWGSDWPWTRHEGRHTYRDCRMALDDWVPREHLGAILWDNPARLYGFSR